MTLHTVNIRHKGQITLPASIRHELGLAEGDRLVVERRGQEIVLVQPENVVDPTAGALAKYARNLPPMSPSEMREAAARAIVENHLETMRQIERDHEDH